MYFANRDFQRKSAFLSAVDRGEPITLFDPAAAMPAIDGEVTVVGPWSLTSKETREDYQRAGWTARCRVRGMRVVEVVA